MKILKKIASAITLVLLTANTTFAYDKKDEAVVIKKIEQVKKGVNTNDMNSILETIPPKTFLLIAEKTGMSVEEGKSFFKKMMERQMQDIDLDKIHYDVDVSKVKTFKSETNREYALFPTEFSMEVEDKIYKTKGTLFAVNDDDTWYLMRLDESQIPMLNELYPSIKKIELFEAETEILDK